MEITYYNAGKLAADPARPWQVVNRMGVLLGEYATEAEARSAQRRLQADKDARRLPACPGSWHKAHGTS